MYRNGGLDFAETKIIADRAYKMFFEGDFSAGEKNDDVELDDEIIDVVAEEDNKEQHGTMPMHSTGFNGGVYITLLVRTKII